MQAGRAATDIRGDDMEYEHITHSFEPVYDENSRILILGTLPSVASRENNFYYGHKQNRFWKLLAYLLDEPTDIRKILAAADIKQVIANGNKAGSLYKKYQLPLTGMEAVVLPSTSPANAAWKFERLCEAWTQILVNL